MNFQLNEWSGTLSFLSEQWRMILLVSFLLLLLTHYLLPYLWLYYKKERLYRKLPTPVTSPILGRILGHLETYFFPPAELKNLPPAVWFYQLVSQSVRPIQEAGESLLIFYFGPFKWVHIIKGEAAKALLGSSKHLQKAPEYEFFKEYIGDCLLTGNVDKWKIHRKLLTPAFHLEILNKFLPAMNVHSRVFCSLIRSKMDASTGKTLQADIRQLMANCTLDILCETAMGVKLNCQTEGDPEGLKSSQRVEPTSGQQFAELIFTGVDLTCERVLSPWLYPNFLFRLSALGRKTAKCVATGRHFVNSVISERRDTLSKQIEDCQTVEQASARLTDGKRLSFLDLLLVNHLKGDENAFNLSAIEDEVAFFMIAGMDTVATTLQMALLLLGHHADKQALIHQELDAIFAGDSDDDRPISLEDMRQMTYLEMFIKEVMRLYPGVPLVGLTLLEDFQMDAYLVPVGTTVYVNIAAIHRDPQVWTEAEAFLPERFSRDSMEARHSHSYLPFSAGPRNCLGSRYAMLVLKIFLATLLRHYTVHSLTAVEDIQLSFYVFAKPNVPISIEFTPRK